MSFEVKNRHTKIAVLIDADNAPASQIHTVLDAITSLGKICTRRAYGNWNKPTLVVWEEKLNLYAIKPIQQFDVAKGKNASDIAMVVDAMELFYTNPPDAFVFISSDSDFTPLATYLREKNIAVYGVGWGTASSTYIKSCTHFFTYDKPIQNAPTAIVASQDIAKKSDDSDTPPKMQVKATTSDKKPQPLKEKNSDKNPLSTENNLAELKEILAALSPWLPNTIKQLNQVGKILRESGIKKNNGPLHTLFRKYPDYFKILPLAGPPQSIRLIKNI